MNGSSTVHILGVTRHRVSVLVLVCLLAVGLGVWLALRGDSPGDDAAATAALGRLAADPTAARQALDPAMLSGRQRVDMILTHTGSPGVLSTGNGSKAAGYPSYGSAGAVLVAATADPADPAAVRIFDELVGVLGGVEAGRVPADLVGPVQQITLRFVATGEAEHLVSAPGAPIVSLAVGLTRTDPAGNTRFAAAVLTFVANLVATTPGADQVTGIVEGAGTLLARTCTFPYAPLGGGQTAHPLDPSFPVSAFDYLAPFVEARAALAQPTANTFDPALTGPGVHILASNGRPLADDIQQTMVLQPTSLRAEPSVVVGVSERQATDLVYTEGIRNRAITAADQEAIAGSLGDAFNRLAG